MRFGLWAREHRPEFKDHRQERLGREMGSAMKGRKLCSTVVASATLVRSKTIVWNGPMGVFEMAVPRAA